jgi:hypothetical protein
LSTNSFDLSPNSTKQGNATGGSYECTYNPNGFVSFHDARIRRGARRLTHCIGCGGHINANRAGDSITRAYSRTSLHDHNDSADCWQDYRDYPDWE